MAVWELLTATSGRDSDCVQSSKIFSTRSSCSVRWMAMTSNFSMSSCLAWPPVLLACRERSTRRSRGAEASAVSSSMCAVRRWTCGRDDDRCSKELEGILACEDQSLRRISVSSWTFCSGCPPPSSSSMASATISATSTSRVETFSMFLATTRTTLTFSSSSQLQPENSRVGILTRESQDRRVPFYGFLGDGLQRGGKVLDGLRLLSLQSRVSRLGGEEQRVGSPSHSQRDVVNAFHQRLGLPPHQNHRVMGVASKMA